MSFKAVSLILLSVVAVGSIGARFAMEGASGSGAAPSGLTTSLVSATEGDTPGEPGAMGQTLPYLSEASFFALLGFALGYATKKIVKLGLLLIAVIFVGIQVLGHAEVVAVDWNKALAFVNTTILNINENETIQDFLKNRVPTVAGFAIGYLLGFRKG